MRAHWMSDVITKLYIVSICLANLDIARLCLDVNNLLELSRYPSLGINIQPLFALAD
jgi:hypothetical protein